MSDERDEVTPTPELVQWAYKAYYAGSAGTNAQQISDDVNDLGKAGWEMCGADNGYIYFRRPLAIRDE